MCGTCDVNDTNNNENQRAPHLEVDIPKTPTSPLDLSMKKPLSSVDNHCTSTKSEPSSPMDTSSTTETSIDISLPEPIIKTQPKSQWHYRSIKDLLKKHIPLVSGEGPQRTPIQVQIPEGCIETIYLAITVVTLDDQFHDLKVIVPNKTRMYDECHYRKNDLNCLIFNECDNTDVFDKEHRIVYMEITERDHQRQIKDVRVHMFNLYQTQSITKDLIETRQLRQCKLAFWFCIRKRNDYIQISNISYSSIIHEKANNTRSDDLPTRVNLPNSEYGSNDVSMTDNENDDDINSSS